MDTLTIKGMQFRGYHGVHAHEKSEGNDFEVDVILKTDLTAPASSDKLSYAIDYTKIHDIAKEVLAGESVDLIEHLCYKIGSAIETKLANIDSFEVRVRKLGPPLSTQTEYTEARMSWPRS
ncbi:dihydroneopterin aldolase [Gracilimonas mengyeensis]|uniref:7,8-dihydroneopterin aldolase n=1 Tax=Gracilimonas mengyeensis TaxID=1302730 RepID=A0A521E547_9BACT|nr:dihydroneopterin aldolase [Gracilimonas mengyeensis]SMO79076.1 dihydroneopterin aldolase [Gracilimonas mengyeensis]